MAGAKTHQFHILNPSSRPLMMSTAVLILAAGAVGWMHKTGWGMPTFVAGFAAVCTMFFLWWKDVVHEANTGDHTPVVQLHHRYGMILFIASEVMFFVAWFWAYFNAALFPSVHEGIEGVWPPKGIELLDPFVFPLLNTLILLLSGTAVTWAHHALIHDDRKGLKQGLWVTIVLGLLFTCVQAYEYYHAEYGMADSIYGAAFYMATGFHGFHVVVGTIFLMVCLARTYKGDFTARHHFGFEAAAWYWHFVDVVWLFLFIAIYVWGSNFGAAVAHHALG
ncbi:cytochrome c oxidase subunit 3 [Sandarakinorhabdus sp.]|uniref:cytochrome c oxidase subunit 3 n=1 Tax=Sandarakinorhabdus sp. TaxID=1916663 RepID=UPI00286E2F33|nr:cytochrome c oxidase subunit 3 [Sandarakinorhabdus sp.]